MIALGSMLFTLWFYLASIVMATAGQLVVLVAPSMTLPYARLWSRVLLFALPVCGVRYEVQGRENLTLDRPMLIASMHQSAFDTLLWFQLLPKCCYVVKIELTKLPLFGRLVKASGAIGVDRSGGAATVRSLLRLGNAALAEGKQLVIFPEGTRMPAHHVGPLQPGVAALARSAGVAVIPVTTNSGSFWGRGTFGKRPGTIKIVIHPPIEPGLAREALMQKLQAIYEDGVVALR